MTVKGERVLTEFFKKIALFDENPCLHFLKVVGVQFDASEKLIKSPRKLNECKHERSETERDSKSSQTL